MSPVIKSAPNTATTNMEENMASTSNAGENMASSASNEKDASPPSYQQAAATSSPISPAPQPYPAQQRYPPKHEQGESKYQVAYPIYNLQHSALPVDCPVCKQRELTRVEFVSGNTTHLSALLLCLTTLCCFIPYMVNAFKDVEHRCGHCGTALAVWHRSGRTEVLAHGQGQGQGSQVV